MTVNTPSPQQPLDELLAAAPETAAYWQAAAEGRLLLRRCEACGRSHHYPRPICPHCGSDRTAWRAASGQGTIHTFSVMRRIDEPYAIGYVDLAEGCRMLTQFVDAEPDALRIGAPVQVAFRDLGQGYPVPVFHPAAA
ncbi:MAG: Zn-ribbon domain-containing OB-fold protein [Proteobacteria bacterium]|nr:Zn-ribbon domain-containing OB-fold protein [Pseudomonadota bacterium]